MYGNLLITDGWLVVDPCKTPGEKKRLCQNRSLNFSVLAFLPDFHVGFRRWCSLPDVVLHFKTVPSTQHDILGFIPQDVVVYMTYEHTGRLQSTWHDSTFDSLIACIYMISFATLWLLTNKKSFFSMWYCSLHEIALEFAVLHFWGFAIMGI